MCNVFNFVYVWESFLGRFAKKITNEKNVENLPVVVFRRLKVTGMHKMFSQPFNCIKYEDKGLAWVNHFGHDCIIVASLTLFVPLTRILLDKRVDNNKCLQGLQETRF